MKSTRAEAVRVLLLRALSEVERERKQSSPPRSQETRYEHSITRRSPEESMDLGTIANVATAAAVITGLFFGVAEIAHARREREERAAYEVVHAMLTPEWVRAF